MLTCCKVNFSDGILGCHGIVLNGGRNCAMPRTYSRAMHILPPLRIFSGHFLHSHEGCVHGGGAEVGSVAQEGRLSGARSP
jgi:hypothetical protein